MADERTIGERLAKSRMELLDLSGRNRLLNTPRGAGRSGRLEIVEEQSEAIFQRLVAEQKSMSFMPAKAAAEAEDRAESGESDADGREAGDKPLPQPTEEDGKNAAAAKSDDRLQTALNSESLQKRLLKLFYDARTFEEEQGVNVLYLALGFLRWYEDERSTQQRFAPLLLVPVNLVRLSAGARFKIAWTQDDIVTNLSLQEMLRQNFRLSLPEVAGIEDLSPTSYFGEVRKAIAGTPRWEVIENDAVLWFFSFAKFLMYRDLDPVVWPDDRRLAEHRLIKSILGGGFRPEPPIVGDDANIDGLLKPADVVHVLDADSSQAMVVEEVRRGRDLVVQGPPGTGKSQTIANMIATAVKDGKRVLFVAEKMAALEVVKRRLDNIGLGDMCLELHSRKANKRAVLEELGRVKLLSAAGGLAGVAEQATRLQKERDRLNRHANVMLASIGSAGATIFSAVGELVRLQAAGLMRAAFQLPASAAWSRDELARKQNIVDDLALHLGRLGDPQAHPWRGVAAPAMLPGDVAALMDRLLPIEEAIGQLRETAGKLGGVLGAAAPETFNALGEMARAGQHVASAPAMDRAALASEAWDRSRGDIDRLVEAGRVWSEASEKLGGVVTQEAWRADVDELAKMDAVMKAWGRSWFRWFNKKYREASRRLASLLRGAPPKPLAERLAIVEGLQRRRQSQLVVESDDQGPRIGAAAFGASWQGLKSDWAAISRISEWERESPKLPFEPASFRRMAAAVTDAGALSTLVGEVQKRLAPTLQTFANVTAPLQLDAAAAFGAPSVAAAAMTAVGLRMEGWRRQPEAMPAWISYFTRLCGLQKEGLAELAQRLDRGEIKAESAADQLSAAYYDAILRQAFATYPELAAFDGLSHEQALSKFKSLDVERIELSRKEVAAAHRSRLPRSASEAGEIGVINHEINKKRNHLPIRRLLKEAGHAVQAMKPVFMMSPISVAQFLEPGVLDFDLLLVDEASQVEPTDALGAIARCGQMAVVGDDRQLPPTRFFAKATSGEGDEGSDQDAAPTADIESILGLCRAQGLRDEMLRWHYRSRHHSLIAVSNHEFYDDKLLVIPSPEQTSDQLGLRFRHVTGGMFDRGKTATNRVEAAAVAEAVLDHAVRWPHKSLGVGAFSVAQRDAILHELEVRRRQHAELEPFFATESAEPFFVKNLENVQGDERDVIFISVGYAKDADGSWSMNFGPLQNDGGQRRLNVLITRARERCEVFSSIVADDIDLNRARSWGAKALKSFLRYAQFGETDAVPPAQQAYDSEFERQVGAAIAGLRYEVHPQAGIAGFFVDLAVVDPQQPTRYLLGIECDGASYHQSRSARDRDRLRQQVLEDRGWIMHRIWSVDWFKAPTEQLRQAAAAIERAKIEWASRAERADRAREAAAAALPAAVPSVQSLEASPKQEGARAAAPAETTNSEAGSTTPYVEASFKVDAKREVHELSAGELAEVVAKVVQIEGPVHAEEICRRVATLWGLKRTGSRINETVERSLQQAVRSKSIVRDGGFYATAKQPCPIRDRSGVESTHLLKPEYLPPMEIRAAVGETIRAHFGMSMEEAASEAVRLLGFKRMTEPLREKVASEIAAMVSQQALVERNGKLYLNEPAPHAG